MDIGQYLQQYYPHVSSVEPITVNGEVKGYYAKGGYAWDQLYIPVSALNSSNVGMVSYLPGAGGSGNDAAQLRNRIQNNPPDYIISIAAECSDHHNAIQTGYDIAKGMGINVTNNVTVCFSASGIKGFSQTEAFLEQHPDVKSTIIACEPYGGDYFYATKKGQSLEGMKQSGTDIIFVTPKKGFHIDPQEGIKFYKSQGLDAYWLQTNYKGSSGGVHIATNRDVIISGMLDYVLGYSENFNTEPGGDKYSPGWQFIGYDPATGQYIMADYAELAQSGVSMLKIPNLDSLKAVDSFDIKAIASPVQKKYASLKSLTNTEIKNKDGSPISSEYTYVSETMNQLKNQIKQSSFLSGVQNFSFRGGGGKLMGLITECINTYYDIVGSLMNSLSLEADAVISYGQAMVDMDYDLAHGASQVGTITETDNSSKMIKPGGLEAFEEKPPEVTQSPGDQTGIGPSQSGGNNTYYPGGSSGYYPSGGSSSSSSSSSGKQEDSKTEERKKDPVEEKTPKTEEKPQEQEKQPEPTQATQQESAPQEQPPAQQQQPVYNPEPEYYPEPDPGVPQTEEGPVIDSSDIPDVTINNEEINAIEDEIDIAIPNEETTIPTTVPSISRIPVGETPIEAPTKKKGNAILPVIAGLTLAGAAGIGAKAYIDHKTNQKNDTEEYVGDDYDEETMDFTYQEDELPEEAYSARTNDELADIQ